MMTLGRCLTALLTKLTLPVALYKLAVSTTVMPCFASSQPLIVARASIYHLSDGLRVSIAYFSDGLLSSSVLHVSYLLLIQHEELGKMERGSISGRKRFRDDQRLDGA